SHSPVCWFFLRLLTAKRKFATFPPVENVRVSGSFVSRPISITLFRFAMVGCLLRWHTPPSFAPESTPDAGDGMYYTSVCPGHGMLVGSLRAESFSLAVLRSSAREELRQFPAV